MVPNDKDWRIHKYGLVLVGEQRLRMPGEARFLSCQAQHDQPMVWFLVNTASPPAVRRFYIRTTGEPVNGMADKKHLGTFLLHDGTFVGHLFTDVSAEEDPCAPSS